MEGRLVRIRERKGYGEERRGGLGGNEGILLKKGKGEGRERKGRKIRRTNVILLPTHLLNHKCCLFVIINVVVSCRDFLFSICYLNNAHAQK